MKKSILILAVAAFAAVSFTSCKKCITCSYDFGGTTASSGEVCGSKSDIDAVQKQWEDAGKAAGVTTKCE